MKKFSLLVLLAAFTLSASAQNDQPDPRSRIEAARAAYITERLALTPDEAQRFWPVYREYDAKRMELQRQRRNLNKPDPDKTVDENQRNQIDNDLKLRQDELDLNKEYTERFLKIIPAQKLRMLKGAEEGFRNLLIQNLRNNQMDRQREMRDRIQQRPRNN